MFLLQILYSLAAVALLGLILGIGLAFASKILAVKRDERVVPIENALPGLNCGTCGYVGCVSYATAIVEGDVSLDLCKPGGDDAVKNISEIMGVEFTGTGEKKVPQVHCIGGRETSTYVYRYAGIKDCNALFPLYKGNKACKFGCIGEGSCIRVCPVEAIDYNSEGLVWVNKEKCVSCGKCIEVCPTGVMQWVPYTADYIVACNSTDKGAIVRKYCSVGCIACKLCERKAQEGGFKVANFLARIDYSVEGDREPGASACPTHCIILNKSYLQTAQTEKKEREKQKVT